MLYTSLKIILKDILFNLNELKYALFYIFNFVFEVNMLYSNVNP